MHKKVFKKIIVSFLPVGHTHEDIDQFFSRLAVYLRSHNAPSRIALGKGVSQAYRCRNGTRPVVQHWNAIANVSDYLIDEGLRTFVGKLNI